MTDDLLTRMRSVASLGAAIKALDDGADEIERLRGALNYAARTLRGETGCEDQGQAYDVAQRIIDAAIDQARKG